MLLLLLLLQLFQLPLLLLLLLLLLQLLLFPLLLLSLSIFLYDAIYISLYFLFHKFFHILPHLVISSPSFLHYLHSHSSCLAPSGGESEEEDTAGDHYEAIYEVISPAHEDCYARQDDPDFDDSFDSDDSDDAYCRLRPQVGRRWRKRSSVPSHSTSSSLFYEPPVLPEDMSKMVSALPAHWYAHLIFSSQMKTLRSQGNTMIPWDLKSLEQGSRMRMWHSNTSSSTSMASPR